MCVCVCLEAHHESFIAFCVEDVNGVTLGR